MAIQQMIHQVADGLRKTMVGAAHRQDAVLRAVEVVQAMRGGEHDSVTGSREDRLGPNEQKCYRAALNLLTEYFVNAPSDEELKADVEAARLPSGSLDPFDALR